MSKIVCDVCGTSYPDSATQCPICGCIRPGDGIVLDNSIAENDTTRSEGYSYVKGGRFSRSNVRKRNIGESAENKKGKRAPADNAAESSNKGDKGLIVAVCMLLLAIVAVVIYIVIHFFGTDASNVAETGASVSTQPSTTVTLTTEEDLSCTEIILSQTSAELEIGQSHQLTVTTTPQNTTDEITFTSSNEAVATVSTDGLILAVASGETKIIIMCGNITAEFVVVCSAPIETTENTEPIVPTETSQPTSEYTAPFKIKDHISGKPTERDATIYVGQTFNLILLDANNKSVPLEWSVDNAAICIVDGNTVKGKSKGTTNITATYEGVTYTCIVRVKSSS